MLYFLACALLVVILLQFKLVQQLIGLGVIAVILFFAWAHFDELVDIPGGLIVIVSFACVAIWGGPKFEAYLKANGKKFYQVHGTPVAIKTDSLFGEYLTLMEAKAKKRELIRAGITDARIEVIQNKKGEAS